MKIGIIGAGNMGSAFARRLSAAEHDVTITAKDPEHAQAVASSVGARVRAVPQQDVAKGADLLILATPHAEAANALKAAGDLRGKVVIDITNPLKPDMSGLSLGFSTSAAEEIQNAVPGTRVVKAFNTVFAQILGRSDAKRETKVQVFYAGDDESAKKAVRSLIESAGFEAVDSGPLANARLLEPVGMFNIYLGYVAGLGTGVAPAWVTAS